MSNLTATNYRASATGFLPQLYSPEIIETLAPAGTTASSTKGSATNVSFATAAAAGTLTFTPAVTPPVGAIKEFYNTAAFQATITPGTNVALISGSGTVINTIVLANVVTQFAKLQYTGLNGSGKLVYRLISSNGTTT